jgi:hypothetical protein
MTGHPGTGTTSPSATNPRRTFQLGIFRDPTENLISPSTVAASAQVHRGQNRVANARREQPIGTPALIDTRDRLSSLPTILGPHARSAEFSDTTGDRFVEMTSERRSWPSPDPRWHIQAHWRCSWTRCRTCMPREGRLLSSASGCVRSPGARPTGRPAGAAPARRPREAGMTARQDHATSAIARARDSTATRPRARESCIKRPVEPGVSVGRPSSVARARRALRGMPFAGRSVRRHI